MHDRRQGRLSLSLLSVVVVGVVGLAPGEGLDLIGIYRTDPGGRIVEQVSAEQEEEPPDPVDEVFGLSYQVGLGDTLWSIARQYGVPADTLASINGLENPDVIRPGQVLSVPEGTASWYQVRPGDSLWRIAASYSTSVDALVMENGISRADRIQVGDLLVIPGSGHDGQSTASQPTGPRPSVPGLEWPLPVDGSLTSPFGPRAGGFHTGIDIAAPSGTRVTAAAAGVVSVAGRLGNYGLTVILDHGGGVETLYAHLSLVGVSVGQQVDVGYQVGRVGSTGRSTGPHLHFELRLCGEPVNPRPHLTGR